MTQLKVGDKVKALPNHPDRANLGHWKLAYRQVLEGAVATVLEVRDNGSVLFSAPGGRYSEDAPHLLKYYELFRPKAEKLVHDNVQSGWIVGSISSAGLSFSDRPSLHQSLESAKAEAERLAKTSPKKFIVVKVEGAVQVTGITWE